MYALTIDHQPVNNSCFASTLTMLRCYKKPTAEGGSYSKGSATYCKLYALTKLFKAKIDRI